MTGSHLLFQLLLGERRQNLGILLLSFLLRFHLLLALLVIAALLLLFLSLLLILEGNVSQFQPTQLEWE